MRQDQGAFRAWQVNTAPRRVANAPSAVLGRTLLVVVAIVPNALPDITPRNLHLCVICALRDNTATRRVASVHYVFRGNMQNKQQDNVRNALPGITPKMLRAGAALHALRDTTKQRQKRPLVTDAWNMRTLHEMDRYQSRNANAHTSSSFIGKAILTSAGHV